MTPALVVVGTSFGGFDALKVVLGGLPGDFPLPIAIVQHRRGGDDELGGLLARYCALPVADAEDKEAIQPGRVYLAPGGYHLLVEPGSFALSVDEPVLYARPSVDVLFESAADAYGAGTVGVVLTGASRDGAAGLASVKAHGGIAIVQDPATALRRTMPDAALLCVEPDAVLPLTEIPTLLVSLARRTSASGTAARDDGARAPRRQVEPSPRVEPSPEVPSVLYPARRGGVPQVHTPARS